LVSGKCQYGCKPGWKGNTCTKGIAYCMQ
jgi:hypothetical protein